ncbi:MAG: winged helix-turn-helix domain-containing protein [Leptothrix sp. (in: b-proteobacteria)]
MEDSYRFGRIDVRPRQRELLIDGRAAGIGARAFDVLLTLIERRGELVTKSDLLDAVWPGMVVEENNLVVQVGTLRKLLGAATIVTIPGRGYRFAATLDADRDLASSLEPSRHAAPSTHQAGNLPAHLPVLYGRSTVIEAVIAELQSHALVTLVGAGGIGKTRIAQAVAHKLRDRWADGAWIAELAPLTQPDSLASALAQLLGVNPPQAEVTVDALGRVLALQSMLLVLDNCEPLLDEVGAFARAILAYAPGVRLLVTSQEPLRMPEEQQVRIPPLPVPPAVDLSEARGYGALELFEARVRALSPSFVLTDDSLAGAIDICRALDGIPLAIELAAARVPALGIAGVRDRLDERLRMLTVGWRGAQARHRTLRATLEWSHSRLGGEERTVFRRLAVFSGGFTSELAVAVAGDGGGDDWEVLDRLSTLVEKSLVVADPGDPPRYRLLESAKAYAAEQLAAADELSDRTGRHARAVASWFERIDTAQLVGRLRSEEHLASLLPDMDNLRAAMRWATGNQGDSAIAMSLAASMAGIEDCAAECARCLLALEPSVDPGDSSATAARFWLAFSRPSMFGRVPLASRREGARRAVSLLRSLGLEELLFYALLRLVRNSTKAGDSAVANEALAEVCRLERPTWSALLRARLPRLRAFVASHRGELDQAVPLLQQAASMYEHAGDRSAEALARIDLVDALWQRGPITEAENECRRLIDLVRQHPPAAATAAMAWSNVMGVLCELCRTDEASASAREGLTFMRRSGSVLQYADTLACVIEQRAQAVAAARLLGASDAYRARCGEARGGSEERLVHSARARLLVTLGAATFTLNASEGASLGEDAVAEIVLAALEPAREGHTARLPGGRVR